LESHSDLRLILHWKTLKFASGFAAEYNTIDRRRVRRMYGFDVAPVTAGSADLTIWKDYFSRDLRVGTVEKGLLRVRL